MINAAMIYWKSYKNICGKGNMVVADALVPTWHQGISNNHVDKISTLKVRLNQEWSYIIASFSVIYILISGSFHQIFSMAIRSFCLYYFAIATGNMLAFPQSTWLLSVHQHVWTTHPWQKNSVHPTRDPTLPMPYFITLHDLWLML